MPPSPAPKSTAAPARRMLLAVLLFVVAIAIAGTIYFWPKPEPSAAPASAASAAAPATAQAAPPVLVKRHIYSETASPRADIAAALVQAKREHKRVIVDFGGDWCGDCQVLDLYFHRPPNAKLLEANYVLVHVWIGHIDTNLDIPEKYGVAIHKGVPALAVLAPSGAVVYAQKLGEFENMRTMDAASVTEFLDKWKG